MKKMICSLLVICMIFMFVGCSQSQDLNNNYVDEYGGLSSIDDTIYLEISEDTYSLQDTAVTYSIINNTGGIAYVVLAPLLERKTESGWETVEPTDVGFCGTPDGIDRQWDGELLLDWYAGSLVAGEYQLNFNMVDSSENFDVTTVLTDCFWLE